jgi:hypothetical protein
MGQHRPRILEPSADLNLARDQLGLEWSLRNVESQIDMQGAIAGGVGLANLVLNLDRGRGAWEGFPQQLDEAVDVLGVVADDPPGNEVARQPFFAAFLLRLASSLTRTSPNSARTSVLSSILATTVRRIDRSLLRA